MAFDKERIEAGSKLIEVITPAHEVDSYSGEELRNEIKNVVNDIDAVIIDFTNITYMNSSGLRELIQILKLMKSNDKSLFLVALSQEIHKIFVHTNLDRLFVFHDTVKSVIDSFSMGR